MSDGTSNTVDWSAVSDEDHSLAERFVERFQGFGFAYQRLLLEHLWNHHSAKRHEAGRLQEGAPSDLRGDLLHTLEAVFACSVAFYRSKEDPGLVWNGIGRVPGWLATESKGLPLKLWRTDWVA